MIDINCQILPGMSQGSKSLAESLRMATLAEQQGITHIIATPHHVYGDEETAADHIVGAVEYLNGKLFQEGISLKVLPGQETRVYGEIIDGITFGEVLPLNKTSKYVLIDLPATDVPNYLTQLQFDMQIAGYTPIITHPEHNQELMDNPDKLYRLVKNGALTQIAAASLTGKSGKKVQKFVRQLVDSNLTHFIASESKSSQKKSFLLQDAYDIIKKDFGAAIYYQFMENSQYVIENLTIPKDQPYRIKVKRGLFK
ncbi:tyrosine-protein phosphatase [Virgibacillus flavescens]|uniref:tyrosine-protein phosphatase n=1 Tax=Virgibacillus flavescens TaxID=1611422 RepID=UPI003D329B12